MKNGNGKFWDARKRLVVALAGIPILAGGW
jgi:hypothetical protein